MDETETTMPVVITTDPPAYGELCCGSKAPPDAVADAFYQEREDRRELRYFFRDLVSQQMHNGVPAETAVRTASLIIEAYKAL